MMNCPMCGVPTPISGPGHACGFPLAQGQGTFSPSLDLQAENAKLRAEVGFQESLYRDASAARDKHWKALQDANLQVDAMRPVVEAAKEVYSVRSEAVVWSQQGVNKSFEKYKVRHQEAGEKLDAAVKTFIEKRVEGP